MRYLEWYYRTDNIAMDIKVSIIIPVYNTEHLIDRCLESVVAQSLDSFEVICVDDGSTDNSGAKLDSWAQRDRRIKVIHQANGRQGKARNAAMAIARGEYIGMVDSDDYIPREYFERLYDAARRADADIAVCGITKQKRMGSRSLSHFEREITTENITEKLRLCNCPPDFHPVNKLYRRSMLDALSLRFAEGVQYEDVMFVTRALCESRRMVCVAGLSYIYVLNPTSTVKSRQTAAKQAQKYSAHRAMVDYMLSRGIRLSHKHRNITVRHYSLCGITIWKIKECDNKRTLRLFDLLPIYRYKA